MQNIPEKDNLNKIKKICKVIAVSWLIIGLLMAIANHHYDRTFIDMITTLVMFTGGHVVPSIMLYHFVNF